MRPSCGEVLLAGVCITLAALGGAILEKHAWRAQWPLSDHAGTLRWPLTALAMMGIFNDILLLHLKWRQKRNGGK